jgi:hypothetical protein
MCTATWTHDEGGYQLLFNRDEKLTRKPAVAPRLTVREGVRCLAPIDGDFGGAWIGTNEFGVSLCLLNGADLTHEGRPCTQEPRSRGLFLLDLIPSPSLDAICERVHKADLRALAPFTLVALETGRATALIEWNGARKTVCFQSESRFMLTSSSFDTEEVRKRRREEYARALNSGRLFDFHRSHNPTAGAYSPCMHRLDAATVSFSWIRVSKAETNFFYTPAAPCMRVPGVNRKLTRRAVLIGRSSGSSRSLPARAAEHPAA